jgi:hypothetical protein
LHFSIFNLNFLNIHKNQENYDKKNRSNFKLYGEDIIPKFDHLIAPYSFTVVSNQMAFSFLTAHNPQQLSPSSQLTTTAKPNKLLVSSLHSGIDSK